MTDWEFFIKPTLFLKPQKSFSNLLSECSSVPQRWDTSDCDEDKIYEDFIFKISFPLSREYFFTNLHEAR